ncbi:MAG TPA: signal peptidase II, partial [Pirellulaceae bacterium]|nr:signal peptidase II [Pirellulaceae bacterium]
GFPDQHARNIHWLIDGFCGIETSLNPGALFGMGAGQSHWFALLSVVAAVGIMVWLTYGQAYKEFWLTIALGSITAGIFGNLYDRVGLWHFADTPSGWQNNVRDWILFRFGSYDWPNFNIADCCLVVGAGVLVTHAFLTPVKNEPKTKAV